MEIFPKTIAVDLDGTILSDEYPNHGRPIDGMKEQLEALQALGWKIIIWTVRADNERTAKYLKEIGIPFDTVNDNPWGPQGSRKIYADVYLDDRAMTFNGDTSGLAKKISEFKTWHAKKT